MPVNANTPSIPQVPAVDAATEVAKPADKPASSTTSSGTAPTMDAAMAQAFVQANFQHGNFAREIQRSADSQTGSPAQMRKDADEVLRDQIKSIAVNSERIKKQENLQFMASSRADEFKALSQKNNNTVNRDSHQQSDQLEDVARTYSAEFRRKTGAKTKGEKEAESAGVSGAVPGAVAGKGDAAPGQRLNVDGRGLLPERSETVEGELGIEGGVEPSGEKAPVDGKPAVDGKAIVAGVVKQMGGTQSGKGKHSAKDGETPAFGEEVSVPEAAAENLEQLTSGQAAKLAKPAKSAAAETNSSRSRSNSSRSEKSRSNSAEVSPGEGETPQTAALRANAAPGPVQEIGAVDTSRSNSAANAARVERYQAENDESGEFVEQLPPDDQDEARKAARRTQRDQLDPRQARAARRGRASGQEQPNAADRTIAEVLATKKQQNTDALKAALAAGPQSVDRILTQMQDDQNTADVSHDDVMNFVQDLDAAGADAAKYTRGTTGSKVFPTRQNRDVAPQGEVPGPTETSSEAPQTSAAPVRVGRRDNSGMAQLANEFRSLRNDLKESLDNNTTAVREVLVALMKDRGASPSTPAPVAKGNPVRTYDVTNPTAYRGFSQEQSNRLYAQRYSNTKPLSDSFSLMASGTSQSRQPEVLSPEQKIAVAQATPPTTIKNDRNVAADSDEWLAGNSNKQA